MQSVQAGNNYVFSGKLLTGPVESVARLLLRNSLVLNNAHLSQTINI